MRSTGLYVLAVLLTLATVPIYRYIYHRAVRADQVVANPATATSVRLEPARSRRFAMTPNEQAAYNAMAVGRAKCVAGTVYRTSDHVIEPWPGNVRCLDENGNHWGFEGSGL